MIKKLDIMKDTRNVIDKAGIVHTAANFTAIEKINELVEFCNDIGNARLFLENHNKQIEKLENKLSILEEQIHPTAKVDPYEKERQWIGKLCRFWDNNYKITKHLGILTRIDETALVRYEAENGFWYCACEPVKPDEDIIFKGE